MKTAVVKQSVYTGGQSVITGHYINVKDQLCEIDFIGNIDEGNAIITRLKNNGSEFQHVRIHEL